MWYEWCGTYDVEGWTTACLLRRNWYSTPYLIDLLICKHGVFAPHYAAFIYDVFGSTRRRVNTAEFSSLRRISTSAYFASIRRGGETAAAGSRRLSIPARQPTIACRSTSSEKQVEKGYLAFIVASRSPWAGWWQPGPIDVRRSSLTAIESLLASYPPSPPHLQHLPPRNHRLSVVTAFSSSSTSGQCSGTPPEHRNRSEPSFLCGSSISSVCSFWNCERDFFKSPKSSISLMMSSWWWRHCLMRWRIPYFDC